MSSRIVICIGRSTAMPENIQQQGDWFEAFYERNYRSVYRICFTYMKNRAETEDCTEDVFVKVLRGGYTFTDEEHERKWLTVTAANLCKDRLRHWFRRRTASIDECPELPDENASVIDETLEVVMDLPTKYKDVVYLHYYMNYKTDEIAQMLERPPSTVRNQLREARELLRKQLGGDVS